MLAEGFSPKTTALVTGGTGYTGRVLVRKLVELGVNVRVIARSSSKRGDLEQLPIDWYTGDVFDASVVADAMKGVNYVFHVAAAFREAKITDEVYHQVHVESTQHLARQALEEPNFRRFVHVSTVGVHGHIDDPPANEEYRFAPGDVYQRTKAEAEQWIRGFSNTSDLPLSVVRPAAIYGPEDKRLLKLFKMSARPVFPLFGRAQGFYHLIHVDDLTDIFITAALHDNALGEVFIAGNPEPTRLKDIAVSIATALTSKPPLFVRLPVWPLFVAAYLCENICKPFGIEPPIYKRRVAFFTKDRAFDTTKLRRKLDYKYSFSVEQGLSSTANWYREAGWL